MSIVNAKVSIVLTIGNDEQIKGLLRKTLEKTVYSQKNFPDWEIFIIGNSLKDNKYIKEK